MKKGRLGSIIIIITAAVLIELVSAVQYYYMRGQLEQSLEKQAEAELTMKAIVSKSALSLSQNTLEDHIFNMRRYISYPDSMFGIAAWIVKTHPALSGCGIAFVPDYYPEKGHLFEPYAMRRGDSVVVRQIASSDDKQPTIGFYHDYTKDGFYPLAAKLQQPCWVDPYLDPITERQTVSYAMPIHDDTGRFVAVFGLDIPIDWLGDTLNTRHVYPSSYDLLLTEQGRLLAGPDTTHVSTKEVDKVIGIINDSTIEKHLSKSGRSTVVHFRDTKGRKAMVFYAFFRGQPRWQIAVVCYDKEVFGSLHRAWLIVLLLSLAGLLLLGYILWRTMNGIQRLEKAHVEQERIGSELRIANNIQMEMLPPQGPAYADRADVDVCGRLVPAREVGGDLFDYFLRDEKLFFCIGDVSGKGVPSAMVMAVVHSLFRQAILHDHNTAHVMQTINEVSCENNRMNMFVTLFIGILDLPTGRLRYCNAGHDVPIIIGRGPLEAQPNLPVGVFDDFKYKAQETVLESGQMLLLYTDGLTEAMNRQRQQFGLERVNTLLSTAADRTPEQLLTLLTGEVDRFVEGAEQSDDLTMLAIRYTPVTHTTIMSRELTLENDVRQVTLLNDFVKEALQELEVETTLTRKLQLAVEEAVVNVMNYAYPSGTVGTIQVAVASNGSALKFTITDSGKAFDPTETARADTSLSAEDRPIGGLGILLVRELMDSVNYERENGRNVLTLRKKYK